ncbi:MAG: 4-alpha-glucanotransferase, partial [Candidatus Binatia bacterium]
REILEVALAESGKGSVVAEDLGSIPDFVRECMQELDVPGYKVLRWEWTDGAPIDPRDYPECSIATTGTHDTDTLVAWWRGLSGPQRSAILSLLGEAAGAEPPAELAGELRERILARLYEAGSRHVILPIQDLFGWEERINLPATISAENWSFRMPVAIEELAEEYRDVTDRLRTSIDGAGRLRTMT